MRLRTITGVKPFGAGSARLLLRFDDDDRPELTDTVDLSHMLAQGGVFEPLRDPQCFEAVRVGPRGRTLVWRVGPGEDDILDLCADALCLMAHPVPAPSEGSAAVRGSRRPAGISRRPRH